MVQLGQLNTGPGPFRALAGSCGADPPALSFFNLGQPSHDCRIIETPGSGGLGSAAVPGWEIDSVQEQGGRGDPGDPPWDQFGTNRNLWLLP